jgi:hypothetical protein
LSGSVRFLVAGVQKGGTSALFDHLLEVPGLQLPAIKEAHWFDDETVDWSAPDPARYHALFEADGRLWGEATPIYIYWPQSLERIQRYDPAMRLILLFRDPVERAWSHWRMEYARGKETQPFAWCIREGRARVDDPTAPGHHRVFSYVERGFYGRQIERLLALFPRDQLLMLRSADLKADPEKTVRAVCAFLGVAPPAHPIVPRRVRVAADMPYPSRLETGDIALLRGIYADDQLRFRALTGHDFFGN